MFFSHKHVRVFSSKGTHENIGKLFAGLLGGSIGFILSFITIIKLRAFIDTLYFLLK